MDFNRAGVGSNFQKPIATKREDATVGQLIPAPNAYNLSDMHTGKKYLVTAEAAFKSKTRRDVMSLSNCDNPAPCQYTIQDKLIHHSASPHKSVFNSKTPRGNFARPIKVFNITSLKNTPVHT